MSGHMFSAIRQKRILTKSCLKGVLELGTEHLVMLLKLDEEDGNRTILSLVMDQFNSDTCFGTTNICSLEEDANKFFGSLKSQFQHLRYLFVLHRFISMSMDGMYKQSKFSFIHNLVSLSSTIPSSLTRKMAGRGHTIQTEIPKCSLCKHSSCINCGSVCKLRPACVRIGKCFLLLRLVR